MFCFISDAVIVLLVFISVVIYGISSQTVTFNGKSPAKVYQQGMDMFHSISGRLTWNDSSVNIDLLLFRPKFGWRLEYSENVRCGCQSSGTEQTVSRDTGLNFGTYTFWVTSSDPTLVEFTLEIKDNGNLKQNITSLIGRNSSFFKINVPQPSLMLFIKFKSDNSFDLALYEPGSLEAGPPIIGYNYPGGGNTIEKALALTTSTGDYYLQVRQTPPDPSSGWSSLVDYEGEMTYGLCKDYMNGCLDCQDSQICTQCLAGFNLNGTTCTCLQANCNSCINQANPFCQACLSNFYITFTGECQLCSVPISQCLQCPDTNYCSLCTAGHFFNQSLIQCRPCYEAFQWCLDCTNDTLCFQCQSTHYFDGYSCVECYNHIDNCLECTTIDSVCLLCDNLTYLDGGSCAVCGNALQGCLFCNNSASCLECDTGYILIETTGQCLQCNTMISFCTQCSNITSLYVECFVCQMDSYLNQSANKCQLCNQTVANCVQCYNDYNCSICDWGYYLENQTNCQFCNQSIDFCVNCTNDGMICYDCITDKYTVLDDICQLCTNIIDNCTRCVSPILCTNCDQTYHLWTLGATTTCKLCSASMMGCLTCESATNCSTVISDEYFIYSATNLSAKCNVELSNCLRCSDQNTCLECQSTHFLDAGECKLCEGIFPFCVNCQNISFCQTCDQDFYLDPIVKNCTCRQGFYVEKYCTSVYGCISARKIHNKSKCLLCDTDKYFYYNPRSYRCDCVRGYKLQGDQCVEICGDGIRFDHECDDGNLVSLDGCDEHCNIQEGYICEGKLNEIQKCYIEMNFTIQYLYTVRYDNNNQAYLYFAVQPKEHKLSRIDFQKLLTVVFQQNIDNSSRRMLMQTMVNEQLPTIKPIASSYEQDTGRIWVKFFFYESLLNEKIPFYFNVSSVLKAQSISFTLYTQSLRPQLTLIKQEEFFQRLSLLTRILSYLILIFFLISLLFHKLIGIEVLSVFQIILISTLVTDKAHEFLRILTNLNPLLGISELIRQSYVDLIKPQKMRIVGQNRCFLYLVSLTAGVYSLALLVYLLLSLKLLFYRRKFKNYIENVKQIKKRIKGQSKSKKEKIKTEIEQEKFLIKDAIFHSHNHQWLFYERVLFPFATFLLIPFVNLSLRQSLTTLEGSPLENAQLSSTIIIFLGVSIGIVVMSQLRYILKNYKQSQLKLTFYYAAQSIKSQYLHKYTACFLLFNLIIAFMVFLCEFMVVNLLIAVLFLITLFYGIFICCWRPYFQTFHHKALYCGVLIILYHMGILFYVNLLTIISQIVMFVLILGEIVFGYILCFLGFYRLYLQHKNSTKKKYFEPKESKQKVPEKKIQDTFKFNPYMFRQNVRKNISLLGSNKIPTMSMQGQLFEPNDAKNHEKSPNSLQEDQLALIKKRLRRQFEFLKQSE